MIYLIVVTSTVGLVVAAQTWPLRWAESRLESAKRAVTYWQYVETSRDSDLKNAKTLVKLKPTDTTIEEWSKLLRRGKTLSDSREIISSKMAIKHLDEMRESFNRNVLVVKIPIVGVAVDINVIGPLIGLIFVILLAMFRITLGKDLEILIIVRQYSKNSSPALRRECYYRLSLSHVLMRPQSEFLPLKKGFWTTIPKAVALIPFTVLLMICLTDFSSYWQGEMHSELIMELTVWTEVIFLLLVALLTWCIIEFELWDIAAQWDDWFKEVKSLPAE